MIFDLVAAQSPSYRGRGIARYSIELARAMVRRHPELISSMVVHPELEPPEGIDDLADWLTTRPDWEAASVVHLSSAFEPEVPVRVYWPREATSHRLLMSVTLYDLIPDVFPGWYLEDPGLRRRWRCCREVVRTADAVLTPSESAKADTIGLLGVPEQRVSVVGSGTAPAFRLPKSRRRAFEVAQAGVEGLKKGFIVYNGAFNPRKGIDNLIEGYASLASELVRRHQLVIVCEAPPLTRNHYLVMAQRLGVEDRLLIPGFVPDDVLVSLYQCTELAVFPSLYEGYGLPVVESMACGAPTMAGDNSSLQEILPRDARFQPADPGAIAEAITRGLTDKAFRERLLALTTRPVPTWDAVADKAAAVFEGLLQRSAHSRPGWRRRPQLALVGLPSGLAEALSAYASVDQYAWPAESDPDGSLGGALLPGTEVGTGVNDVTEPDAFGPGAFGPEDSEAVGPGEAAATDETVDEEGAPLGTGPPLGTGAPLETGPPLGTGAPLGTRRPVDEAAPGRNGAFPLTALGKIDPWRGGYDAIVSWASGAEGQHPEPVEKLVAEWPGRVVALVGAGPGGAAAAPFSTPGATTIMMADDVTSWEETARRVAEAARAKAL